MHNRQGAESAKKFENLAVSAVKSNAYCARHPADYTLYDRLEVNDEYD